MQLNRSGGNRAAVMAVLEDADNRHICVKSENVKNTIHFQTGQLLGFLAQLRCFEDTVKTETDKSIQSFKSLQGSFPRSLLAQKMSQSC